MVILKKVILPLAVFMPMLSQANASLPVSKWVSLDSDSKSRVKRTIQSEAENRDGFSTSEEEKLNLGAVEDERQKEISSYKRSIENANREFTSSKKKRDDLNAQFQTASYDYEESQKNIKTIGRG